MVHKLPGRKFDLRHQDRPSPACERVALGEQLPLLFQEGGPLGTGDHPDVAADENDLPAAVAEPLAVVSQPDLVYLAKSVMVAPHYPEESCNGGCTGR